MKLGGPRSNIEPGDGGGAFLQRTFEVPKSQPRPRRKCRLWQFGRFPASLPANWPPASLARYHSIIRSAIGRDAGRNELIIFDFGTRAALLFEDSFAALSYLDIAETGWSTNGGFPSYWFLPADIEDHAQTLCQLGYRVFVLQEQSISKVDLEFPGLDLVARSRFTVIQGGRRLVAQ